MKLRSAPPIQRKGLSHKAFALIIRFMPNTKKKFSRRTLTFFWTLLVGVVIAALIYFEQISILYVLATLALVVLLLVVSFADLEKIGFDNGE